MADKHNVFISWSGARSKAAAEALREWLPIVIQAAKPWMSDSDIDKGSRGLDEIAKALEGMKVGIICLAPENLTAEWILYEAGALSKTLDAKTRVCTYLLGGLQPQDVRPPLGMFQATQAVKDETKKMIHTINRSLDTSVVDGVVDTVFDKMWPDMERKLLALPTAIDETHIPRTVDDMVAEILELNRAMIPEIREFAAEAAAYARAQQTIPSIYSSFRSMPPVNLSEVMEGKFTNALGLANWKEDEKKKPGES
jgi:hypothetical protein